MQIELLGNSLLVLQYKTSIENNLFLLFLYAASMQSMRRLSYTRSLFQSLNLHKQDDVHVHKIKKEEEEKKLFLY